MAFRKNGQPHGIGPAGIVVEEKGGVNVFGKRLQPSIYIIILRSGVVNCFCVAGTVSIVGIGGGDTAFGSGGQLSSILPGEGQAIPIGERIADIIVGDGLAVVSGELVLPRSVTIGVGVGGSVLVGGEDIAAGIVGVGIGFSVDGGTQQLIERVVGVTLGQHHILVHLGDVTHRVVVVQEILGGGGDQLDLRGGAVILIRIGIVIIRIEIGNRQHTGLQAAEGIVHIKTRRRGSLRRGCGGL